MDVPLISYCVQRKIVNVLSTGKCKKNNMQDNQEITVYQVDSLQNIRKKGKIDNSNYKTSTQKAITESRKIISITMYRTFYRHVGKIK